MPNPESLVSQPICDTMEQAVDVIRRAPLRALRSSQWLEHELLPSLGLAEGSDYDFPGFLRPFRNRGLKSFQQPSQFSKYLTFIAEREIETYLEVGCYLGGTFIVTVEYLSRFRPIRHAAAIDVEIQEPMRRYAALNPAVALMETPSVAPAAKEFVQRHHWDLALIDGDHSEEGCFADWQLVRDYATLVSLHDTHSDVCAPVGAVWERLKAVMPRRRIHEFHEQYVDLIKINGLRAMGIGVVDLGA